MAGILALSSQDFEIQDATGATEWRYEGEWLRRPVVRPKTSIPLAVQDEDGVRAVVRAQWGFPVGAGRPVGNARDDKLQSSPMWSKMLGTSHGLVACSGVYEMVRDGEEKRSYWFRPVDGRPLLLPALWGMRRIGGEQVRCCAVVTTRPNAFFARYHDRSVCGLAQSERDRWMEADPDEAMGLLHAPALDALEAVPVPNRVFAPGRIEFEDIVALGPPERWEG